MPIVKREPCVAVSEVSMDLRAQLLGVYSGDEAAGSATLNVTVPRSQAIASVPPF